MGNITSAQQLESMDESDLQDLIRQHMMANGIEGEVVMDDDENYSEDEEIVGEEVYSDEEEGGVEGSTNTNTTATNSAASVDKANREALRQSELAQQIYLDSGCRVTLPQKNVFSLIDQRSKSNAFSRQQQVHISQRFLPQERTGYMLKHLKLRGFCGQYSKDGSMFMSATEGRSITIFDTVSWKPKKEIVGCLEIRDTDYSPDQRWCIYSGWSSSIYLANLVGEHEVHDRLRVVENPSENGWGHFCLFSVKFSPSSDEVIGGSSDSSLYVYDLNRRELLLRVEGHNNDINTVGYLDNTNNMILTAGDDCLIKLWDRRVLGDGIEPVGVFTGHSAGITHVSSKQDGRYFITNGKDQVAKLWDIRKMAPQTTKSSSLALNSYDYRFSQITSRGARSDCSLMSYRGHSISKTLIRCYFSPSESTGQKYIISGSGDGCIYIYDVITGNVVKKLKGHNYLVRDVSCHPYDLSFVSTSWDTTLGMWSFGNEQQEFFPKKFTSRNTGDWW